MTDRDMLIEIFKKTEYTPFPEMTMKSNLGNQFTDYALNHIVDELLANGIIVLPCKVGDKIYSIIYQKKNVVSHILIEEYVGIHLSNAPDLRGHRRKNYIIVWNENTNSIRHIDINKIGKTVFLTKEEAEEKLRELKDNGNL